MRRILIIALTVLMIAAVAAGCAAPTPTTAPTSTPVPTAAPSGPVIDFNETPYVVDMQLVALFEKNTDLPAIEAAVNEILLKKINAKIAIKQIFIGDLATKTSLAVAGKEKIDLVTVGLTQRIEALVPDGILMPLDDLLAERGQGVTALTAKYAAAGIIDGKTYAVTAYPFPATASGFVYNKTMADELGITFPAVATYADITAAFEKVKAKGVYGTTFGSGGLLSLKFWQNLQVYGNNGAFGVIMDPANSTTIENVFATAQYKDYCKLVKSWAQAGYLPADSLTDTTPAQQYFAQGKIFGSPTAVNPDNLASWSAGQTFEVGIVAMSPALITTAGVTECMWGIASNCARPDKAMDVLSVLYSDAAVANLLSYGLEGKDYQRVSGTTNVITGEGATSGPDGYRVIFSRFGNPLAKLIMSPNKDSYYTDLKTLNDSAVIAKDFGYSFNSADYSAENAQITNVINQYMPMLSSGFADDVDAQIATFVAALETAGIKDVIAENQKQLDAFLAK